MPAASSTKRAISRILSLEDPEGSAGGHAREDFDEPVEEVREVERRTAWHQIVHPVDVQIFYGGAGVGNPRER